MKKINGKLKHLVTSFAYLAVVVVATTFCVTSASAQTINPAPVAKVSFTFDDGLASAINQAAPALATYGIVGTEYVNTGCIGTTATTCADRKTSSYMSWAQITNLQKTYGWEIGSHTVTHPLSSTVTDTQIETEMSQSKATLLAHGFNATSFATPYGDYDNRVLASVAKYYSSHRGFWDVGNNTWPNNDYLVKVQQVQGNVSVAKVKGYIDTAIANKQWLVLVFHDIKITASTKTADYQYSTANLKAIAAYVKSKNLATPTISNALVVSSVNMLPNSTFDSGITGGWTTDDIAGVVGDSGNHGSYPSPTRSVAIKITNKTSHLFSPQVDVDAGQSYVLKNFLNVNNVSGVGSVGFYIDEYDANGNWVSGQNKGKETTSFVENLNFEYKPTGANVKKARLQIIATTTGVLNAYVDNTQWFPEIGDIPAPTPTPTPTPDPIPPTPAPVSNNLMPNSTFDLGMASGWTTDNTSFIKADSANNGSTVSPVNSIHLTSTSKNIHLFSPLVAVDSTKTYTYSSYINLKKITSNVLGFYIDEYDVNGNWVSGKYITESKSVFSGIVSFGYIPTSAKVKKASLQIIVSANSGIDAYIDDVQLLL